MDVGPEPDLVLVSWRGHAGAQLDGARLARWLVDGLRRQVLLLLLLLPQQGWPRDLHRPAPERQVDSAHEHREPRARADARARSPGHVEPGAQPPGDD